MRGHFWFMKKNHSRIVCKLCFTKISDPDFNLLYTGDSSTVICWMSLFVIFGVSGQFCHFFLFLMENLVSKQSRP